MEKMEIKYWKESDGPLQKKWVTDGIDESAIAWAEKFGHYLADPIKRDKTGQPIQAWRNGRPATDNKGEPIYEKATFLTTSQLRRFFGEVRRIQNDLRLQKDDNLNVPDIHLLKPRLAYQVGREKDKQAKIKDFYQQMSIAIDAVKSKSSFFNFIRLLEAIVAYHKELEPKKEN
jgi:CRISPR type III-A-associated protein Csm2